MSGIGILPQGKAAARRPEASFPIHAPSKCCMAQPLVSRQSVLGKLSHPVLFLEVLLLTPALWMLLVGSLARHEVWVGLAASAATVVFTTFVCQSTSAELKLRAVDLLQGWRIPWYILSGVWEISLILLKDVLRIEPAENLYRVCGFDTSTRDPVRRARSILATAYTTTAPNFIVVGVDPSQSRMLFHQIARSSVPQMTKALGGKG